MTNKSLGLKRPRQSLRLDTAVKHYVPAHSTKSSQFSELPVVACIEPALVSLQVGQQYAWCSCGLSQRQPFCDGSHAGTSWKPLIFTPKRTQLDWVCTCKFTRQPPYCDAAHNRLNELYQRKIQESELPRMEQEIVWMSDAAAHTRAPRVVLIHGLLAGQHMARHLLSWLREAGFEDASLFSNNTSPRVVADFLQVAKAQGRQIALVGYSQGGFQVIKVAKVLASRGLNVDVLVSIAAGGLGRLHPAQWAFPVRRIPSNIHTLLNIYSYADRLGTDPTSRGNALPSSVATQVENIALAKTEGVDHLALVRCYPVERQHPVVRERVLTPLLAALRGLSPHDGT